MKKLVTLVFAGILACSCIAGCGRKDGLADAPTKGIVSKMPSEEVRVEPKGDVTRTVEDAMDDLDLGLDDDHVTWGVTGVQIKGGRATYTLSELYDGVAVYGTKAVFEGTKGSLTLTSLSYTDATPYKDATFDGDPLEALPLATAYVKKGGWDGDISADIVSPSDEWALDGHGHLTPCRRVSVSAPDQKAGILLVGVDKTVFGFEADE